MTCCILLFSALKQFTIAFCSFCALNLTKKQCISEYEAIINYINTNHKSRKKKDKLLKIIELKQINKRLLPQQICQSFKLKFKDHTATKIFESRESMFKANINPVVASFTSLLFALKPVWAQSKVYFRNISRED